MSEPDNPGSAAAPPLRSVAKARAITIIAELGINVALPFAIYSVAEPKLGEIHALMLSCVSPLLCGIVELVRRRRIDAISILSIGGIILSLLRPSH
jgi:dolichol kinase